MTRRRSLLSIAVVALALMVAPAILLRAGGHHLVQTASASSASPVPAVQTVIEVHAGQTKTIFENGQFKITGSCLDGGGGNYTARAYLATKQDNANYFITDGTTFDLDFDKADGAVNVFHYPATGTTPDFQAWDLSLDVVAESAGGKVLIARVASGVHQPGMDCSFSGLFLHESSGTPTRNVQKVNAGSNTTLYDNDTFKVTGSCINNGGGNYTARALLTTKKNNSMYYISNGPTSVLDFDKTDPAVAFDTASSSGTTPDFAGWDFYSEVYAVGSKGQTLYARVATGVHMHGADCTFSGLFADSSTGALHEVVKVGAGGTKTLFENNQFRVTGWCQDNGGGNYSARAYVATKDDNSRYFISNGPTEVDDFDVADGTAQFAAVASGTSPAFIAKDYYSEVYIESGHGQVLIARVATGVHLFGTGCIFAGIFQDGN